MQTPLQRPEIQRSEASVAVELGTWKAELLSENCVSSRETARLLLNHEI
jgi:hypothetical protein